MYTLHAVSVYPPEISDTDQNLIVFLKVFSLSHPFITVNVKDWDFCNENNTQDTSRVFPASYRNTVGQHLCPHL